MDEEDGRKKNKSQEVKEENGEKSGEESVKKKKGRFVPQMQTGSTCGPYLC